MSSSQHNLGSTKRRLLLPGLPVNACLARLSLADLPRIPTNESEPLPHQVLPSHAQYRFLIVIYPSLSISIFIFLIATTCFHCCTSLFPITRALIGRGQGWLSVDATRSDNSKLPEDLALLSCLRLRFHSGLIHTLNLNLPNPRGSRGSCPTYFRFVMALNFIILPVLTLFRDCRAEYIQVCYPLPGT